MNVIKKQLRFMEITMKAMLATIAVLILVSLLTLAIMSPVKFLFLCSIVFLIFTVTKRLIRE